MRSVLKRAEEASKELAQLALKNLKLTNIKITKENSDTGHFRLKGCLNEKDFIEIFEFYYSGNLLKYSYTYVKDNLSILRYDNAPHYNKLNSFPHHKHYQGTINELKKSSLKDFVKELIALKK